MLLSDKTIRYMLMIGRIGIDPLPMPEAMGSCSVDLCWSGRIKKMHKDGWIEYFVPPAHTMELHPGEFALASTLETIILPTNIAGRLEGRSSLARLGLAVHSTAGLFDPGWHGVVTLELSNVGAQPIQLHHGMRICAMSFEQLDQYVEVPYGEKPGSKYAGQTEPTFSKIVEERR